MSLIEGESLQERWSGMSEGEKRAVCEELKNIVKMWRSLKQGKQDYYIGSFDKQPLNEVFLESHPKLAGPFQGANATQQFQNACGIEIDHEVPIVFTHNDFVPPNILLSPGSNPKVAAIIDWGQAGWYPAYWEYCKARRVNLVSESFDDALQEEWRKKYLPMILDPVDDEEYYNPWLWFVLSDKGRQIMTLKCFDQIELNLGLTRKEIDAWRKHKGLERKWWPKYIGPLVAILA